MNEDIFIGIGHQNIIWKELTNAQNEGISKYVFLKYFCIILGNRNNFHVESLALNADE